MQSLLRKFRSQPGNSPSQSTLLTTPNVPVQTAASPLSVISPPPSLPPQQQQPIINAPVFRKIHPNLEALAQEPDPRTSSTSSSSRKLDEFGQVPPALARIANRKVDKSIEGSKDDVEVTADSSSPIVTTPPPSTRGLSKLAMPLFSTPSGWSTFGRRDRANAPNLSLSRGSSQSRPPTRTPPKSTAASRSNSTRKPETSSQNNTSSNTHNSSPTTHDSPRTFGTPSLARRASSTSSNHYPAHNQTFGSSSPPMTTHLRDVSNSSDPHGYQTTYPPRTRKLSSNLNYSSLQFTFGRNRNKKPHADAVFPSDVPTIQTPIQLQADGEYDRTTSSDWIQHQPVLGQAAQDLVRISLVESSPQSPELSSPNPASETSEPYELDWKPDIPISTLVQFDANDSDASERQARLEHAVKFRERTEERKRRRTISSTSSLRRGALRRTVKDKPFPQPLAAFPTAAYSDTSSAPSTPIRGILRPLTSTTSAPAINLSTTDGTKNPATARNETSGEEQQLMPTLSVTAPTPMASPSRSTKEPDEGQPTIPTTMAVKNLKVPQEGHTRKVSLVVHGKRKAVGSDDEDEEGGGEMRSRRPSDAPSSYPRKRMRVHSPEPSSRPHSPGLQRGPSSLRSGSSAGHGRSYTNRHSRNASQVSIPISAILAPRASSIHRATSNPQTRKHDPLKNKYRELSWEETWRLDRNEMSAHAWLFLAGFLIPFAWWIGSVYPLPVYEDEKAADLEDQQQPKSNKWTWGRHRRRSTSATVVGADPWVHHALLIRARAWRLRCIIASIVSVVVYVPVIVVAVIYSRK